MEWRSFGDKHISLGATGGLCDESISPETTAAS
jgi:hypothetical protein